MPRFALRTPERIRPHLHLLPLLGLIPSFLLATWSLTQPWARGRFLGVIGISRSPEAVMLVVATLAGMVAASVAVAARGDRLQIAGTVHLVMGALMGVVAWTAFRMVRDAGIKILFIPIATVHPGRGLRLFVLAAGLVLALGVVELLVARRRVARPPGPNSAPAPDGTP